MLQFYSGSSDAIDAHAAVSECVREALGDDRHCELIIIYVTMGHEFEEVLSAIASAVPGARVVGCTCAGIITGKGANESMRALALMAVRGQYEEVAVTSVHNIIDVPPYDLGVQVAQDLRSQNPDITLMMVHPSILDCQPADELIQGVESVLPNVGIFGGLANDNMRLTSNAVFSGTDVYERSAVAIGFADPTIELVAGAHHGFRVYGEPLEVSRSSGNRVQELDGKPAWACIMERLGMPATTEPAEISAIAVVAEELPQEVHEEYGSRFIIRGGPLVDETGATFLTGNAPVGCLLWLMRRDEQAMFEGVERLAANLVERCGDRTPIAMIHADCAARGRRSFNRILKDEIVRRMQQPVFEKARVPWFGMYGGGELTPLGGKNRIHVYTSSLCLLVRRNG
jgi:hypothetical protein